MASLYPTDSDNEEEEARAACRALRLRRSPLHAWLTVTRRPQEDEDAPRPLTSPTGFFFGNVTNRLRLQRDEGRYLGEVRARPVARRSAARLRVPAAVWA